MMGRLECLPIPTYPVSCFAVLLFIYQPVVWGQEEAFCSLRNTDAQGAPIELSFQGTNQHFGGDVNVIRDGGSTCTGQPGCDNRQPTTDVPQKVVDGVSRAIKDVEDTCDESEYIPDFTLKLATQRPVNQPNNLRFTTLGLSYDPNRDPEIIEEGGTIRIHLAEFESNGANGSVPMSTVILAGTCPQEIDRSRCHKVPGEGWKIDWSLPVNQAVIAHEILHALVWGMIVRAVNAPTKEASCAV